MDSFFGKSGTLQNLTKFANSYNQSERTKSSTKGSGALSRLVQMVMSLLG